MQESELGTNGISAVRTELLLPARALGLDPQRRLMRFVEQLHDLAPGRVVEFELEPVDLDLGMVEAGLAAGRRRPLEDLGQRPPERLAAEGRRQSSSRRIRTWYETLPSGSPSSRESSFGLRTPPSLSLWRIR